MSFNAIDFNNTNHDDDDYCDEDDLETGNHIRPMTWHNRFK